jgi:hypothetical protein
MQLAYLNAAVVKLAGDPVFGLAGEEEPQARGEQREARDRDCQELAVS